MDLRTLCLVFVLAYTASAQDKNIWDIVKADGQLSSTENAIAVAGLNTTQRLDKRPDGVPLNPGERYTLFAPIDSAWTGVTAPTDKSEALKLMQYHIVKYEILTVEVMKSEKSSPTTEPGNAIVFFTFKTEGNEMYVNQARISESIVASNGIIHKITSVLVVGMSENADSYVKSQASLSEFTKYMGRGDSTLPLRLEGSLKYDGPVTIFIPNNAAVTKIPPQFRDTELWNNVTRLKEVVNAHVIEGRALYSTGLTTLPVGGLATRRGPMLTTSLNNGDVIVNVGNVNAKVVVADLTVNNGVVHVVDSVLNYIYTTMWSTIANEQVLRELQKRLESLNNAEIRNGLTQNKKGTYFAPVDQAFFNLPQDVAGKLITAEGTNIFKMHWIQTETIGSKKLTDGTTFNTAAGVPLKVITITNGTEISTYVEVNHVRGKIVSTDIGTKNGIIHYVDAVLGLPSGNIIQEIGKNILTKDRMNKVFETLKLTNALEDQTKTFTVFAVTNNDMTIVLNTKEGKELSKLGKFRDLYKKVINRHIVEDLAVFTDGVDETGKIIKTKSGEDILLYKNPDGNYYISMKYSATKNWVAKIVQANIAVINGVVHVVDDVLFGSQIELDKSTSGSNQAVSSAFFVGVLSIFLVVAAV